MIDKDAISEAMRNTDAIAAEHEDIPGYWTERGVDTEGLTDCAMQHGLRVVMVHQGRSPNLPRRTKIALSTQDQRAQVEAAGSWMAGFAVAERLFRATP